MASFQQTQAASKKKQPKARRSLKKQKVAPHFVEPSNALAINMSKSQLDNIFMGLHTGQLENPQMALAQVYLLALDSIENALVSGIADICKNFASPEPIPVEDNPIAPWINHILRTNPDKIDSFVESLKTKLHQTKENLKSSVGKVLSQDAAGDNIIGAGSAKNREELLALLRDPESKIRLPIAQKLLSDDRLAEIYNEIQNPSPDNGKKLYHFTKTPGSYRFSFGSNNHTKPKPNNDITAESVQKDSVQATPESEQTEAVSAQADHIAETLPSKLSAQPQDSSVNATECDATQTAESAKVQAAPERRTTHIPIAWPKLPAEDIVHPEFFQSIMESSADVSMMAREVTNAMTELAIQIGNETIKAFAEDHILPTLSEALKDDPRLSQDEELSAFIDSLEEETNNAPDDENDSLDNDELAKAFGLLLDEFDAD